ncbi:P-loop containing nucleoside triphosphate hydrolase protein [Syncephalis plumigaleata]|nr:P-loop containing nucleoside triphosphate hydrolase protein [Syncephalis plumigaleata]
MPDWLLSAVKKNVASDAAATQTITTTIDTTTATTSKSIESSSISEDSSIAATTRTRDQTSSLFTANPTVPTRVDRWKADKARQADGSTATSGISNVQHLSDKMDVQRPTGIQRHMLQSLFGEATKHDNDRDVILQSETGSGKTLAYLLPIVHQLLEATPTLPYSSVTGATARTNLRSLGTMACILTPTRETLLQYKSSNGNGNSNGGDGNDDVTTRRLHWIVPGLVSGGDKRQSEKARLRKGVTILVCTPGRLLDHLQNTQSFEVGQLRWLVLDEADRLLDLGFEDTLLTIINLIKERSAFGGDRKDKTIQHLQSTLRQRRQIILCSATLQSNVRQLAGQSLTRPILIKGKKGDANAIESGRFATSDNTDTTLDDYGNGESMASSLAGAAPEQLRQSYVVVPAKLRLVTLCAFLKSAFGVSGVRCEQRKNKLVIFLSCCSSVDFIYKLLGEIGKEAANNTSSSKSKPTTTSTSGSSSQSEDSEADEDETKSTNTTKSSSAVPIALMGSLLPNIPLYKLHGNMPQNDRSRVYTEFCAASKGVLVCTDVAARGLHLPQVDQIVQYDVPCDIRDYAHRVGRTARLGKEGDALLFLLPSEMAYVDILKGQGMQTILVAMEDILGRLTSSNRRSDYEQVATHLQLQFERWVLSQAEAARLAREAFTAHVRAYATHAASEKHIFHVKFLHLGHLAKSFGLREAPNQVSASQKKRRVKEVGKLKQSAEERFAERKKRGGPFERPQAPKERDSATEARRIMQAAAKRAHNDEFAIVSDTRALLASSSAHLKKRQRQR